MTGRIRKLLSSCTRWVSREVRQEELNDFRVAVTEGSGEARIRLSGLLGTGDLRGDGAYPRRSRQYYSAPEAFKRRVFGQF